MGYSRRGYRVRYPLLLYPIITTRLLSRHSHAAQSGYGTSKGKIRHTAILAQQVIREQQLRDRQRVAVARLAAVAVVAELVAAQGCQVGQMLPNRMFKPTGVIRRNRTIDL